MLRCRRPEFFSAKRKASAGTQSGWPSVALVAVFLSVSTVEISPKNRKDILLPRGRPESRIAKRKASAGTPSGSPSLALVWVFPTSSRMEMLAKNFSVTHTQTYY